jgi:hypothetical protein
MAVVDPEELYSIMRNTQKQNNFDRNLRQYLEDPENYEDPREVSEDDYYDNPAQVPTPQDAIDKKTKARLSLSSTSTTDPEKPRTLSAGYDEENYILTVQFRDGTLYNYYDVPPQMWNEFEAAESKGRFLEGSGLNNWHSKGPAGGNASWFAKRAERSIEQQKQYGGKQIGRTRK